MREDVVRASAALLARIPVEFAVILASDMVRASAKFAREPSYKEFMKKMARSSPAKARISVEELANVGARILRARIRLALSQPFLASALMRLPLRDL